MANQASQLQTSCLIICTVHGRVLEPHVLSGVLPEAKPRTTQRKHLLLEIFLSASTVHKLTYNYL